MPAPPVPGPTRAAHDPSDQRWQWRARLGGCVTIPPAGWRCVVLLTAGVDSLGEVRDSDGELAGFLGESLATYARLPWQRSGIDAQVYFADLCELCVWENHGLLYQRETAPFASIAVEHRHAMPGTHRPAATPPPPPRSPVGEVTDRSRPGRGGVAATHLDRGRTATPVGRLRLVLAAQ